jgi:hypothetical protein
LREKQDDLGKDDSSRRAFVGWALRSLLSFGPSLKEGQDIPDTLIASLPEHGAVLRPDLAVVDPASGQTRLLVSLWPAGTDFGAHVAGEKWAASPIDRMATHCRLVGTQLGLVTDGDRFCFVWAPRTGPVGRATWVASVFSEAAERTLLDSFTSVLGAKRFFSVAPEDQIEALLAESASAQADVTSQLGIQVRQAVELLVAAFSRANRERGGALLSGLDPHVVYEAACTVMMRLVFLFSAEERRLLPLGDELYDLSYAASTLRQSIQDIADAIGNVETLEHSRTAWPRLLATFRAVHGGLAHDQLRLPAYGGRLFDPDRYPFLEGRLPGESWYDVASTPIPVDDRTMLGILTALQVLEMREAGVTEARRLSFRSLDVEQIGHVYEGLLDHGARRVEEVTLGLVGKPGEESETTLAEIEALAAKGQDKEVARLVELTKRSEKHVRDALGKALDDSLHRRLRAASDNDASVFERVQRYGWLLRDDIRGLPMVLLPGSVHVTEVSHRRDTGTEYTTKELADEVVRYALEPLVYEPGPAEGAPPEEWKLKSSASILALKVCDPAVGSGAIITAACRYLSERLFEAWAAEGMTPATPGAEQGDDVDDVLIAARREIAERCLYGVDRDPMAVEMAKLSLWLITMAKERPFSFLDHSFRAGDSLLGVTRLDQVNHFRIDPDQAQVPLNFAGDLEPFVKEALEKRRQLEASPVVAARDVEEKVRLLWEAERAIRTVNVLADLVVGAALSAAGESKNEHNTRLASVSHAVRRALDASGDERDVLLTELAAQADAWLNERRPEGAPLRRPLHWPLAFPEVFLDGGTGVFDAMVGNPPFLGGTRISGPMGKDYRDYLGARIATRKTDRADLVVFFFLRAATIARGVGFLSTNSISQGDSREAALDPLTAKGWAIHRAVKSTPWPGSSVLEIAKVWLRREWNGNAILDGNPTDYIASTLNARDSAGQPFRLAANQSRTSHGCDISGIGFVLDCTEAEELLLRNVNNRDVLFPFVNGQDLTTSPTQDSIRYVINFFDWPEDIASAYQDCWEIVQLRVRPDRQRLRPDGTYLLRSPLPQRYWQYNESRKELYRYLAGRSRVIAIPRVSKTILPVFVKTHSVFSDAVEVFKYDDDFHFGVLTSAFHWWWTLTYASTLETRIRYTPTDCFETFPQPELSEEVAEAGAALDTHRRQVMLDRSEGLTTTYNRVHDLKENDSEIVKLRELHVELDHAVAAAYGWEDLDLDHGFWETRQGNRYTIGPEVRVEVLDRLLELNHERHAAEVAAGVGKPARGAKAKKKQTSDAETGEGTLFGATLFSGDDA